MEKHAPNGNGVVVEVSDDAGSTEESKNCCDKIFASSCCLAMERIGGHVVTFMEKGFYKLVNDVIIRRY